MKKIISLIAIVMTLGVMLCSCGVSGTKVKDVPYPVMKANTYRVVANTSSENSDSIIGKEYILYSDGNLSYVEKYGDETEASQMIELSDEDYRKVVSVLNDLWSIPNRDDSNGNSEAWLIQACNQKGYVLGEYRGVITHDSLCKMFDIFKSAFEVNLDAFQQNTSSALLTVGYLYGENEADSAQKQWTIQADGSVEAAVVTPMPDGTQEYVSLGKRELDEKTLKKVVDIAKENSGAVAQEGKKMLFVFYMPSDADAVIYNGYIDEADALLELCDILSALYAK